MGTGAAIVAAAVISSIAAKKAGKEQRRGLASAANEQRTFQQQLLDFQAQVLEEGQPFREAAGRALPLVEEDVLRDPGGSPLFQRGLQRGIEGIRAGLSGAGLADSSVAGRAIGEFTTGAIAQEAGAIRGQRLGLLGLQGTGFGQAGGLFDQIGGTFGNLSKIGISSGAVRAGTTTAIGENITDAILNFGSKKAGIRKPGVGGAGADIGGGAGIGARIDPFSTTGAGAGVTGVRRRRETGINRVGRRRLR